MIKETLVFLTAFGLCAALGSTGAGCSSDRCECGATPQRPEAQAPLTITFVTSRDALGNQATPAIDPVGGTLAVTGDTVVIRYKEAGVDHELFYAVLGPR